MDHKIDLIEDCDRERRNNYLNEYSKQRWYCPHCKYDVRITNKSNHFKSKKHQLNINIYIDKDG
jgi:transposase-like protein